jgi:hypothetical protein
MADNWYFTWNNTSFGPFSAAQLRDLAALGRLQPTDIVWKDGMKTGVQASSVHNLFPESKTPMSSLGAQTTKVHEAHAARQGSRGLSSSKHSSGRTLASWLSTRYDQQTPDEQLPEFIPNDLRLKEIRD